MEWMVGENSPRAMFIRCSRLATKMPTTMLPIDPARRFATKARSAEVRPMAVILKLRQAKNLAAPSECTDPSIASNIFI